MRFPCRKGGLGGLVLAALLLPGCNNDQTPTGGASAGRITITCDPNPIATIQSNPIGPTFAVRWEITMKESAGLGGSVELLSARLFDDVTGLAIASNSFDDRDLLVFVGTKRIEANGMLEIPQELSYVAAAKRPASLTLLVRFRDDRGNLSETAILVKAT